MWNSLQRKKKTQSIIEKNLENEESHKFDFLNFFPQTLQDTKIQHCDFPKGSL